MANNSGSATCSHCGAHYHLHSISGRDMMALCRSWRKKHEAKCSTRTPKERRAWAKKYIANVPGEHSLTVDMEHLGFQDTSPPPTA
ncbi:hypothetical protein [Pseudomonas aeruginosa]|uniref:hypothetical protein n=1 Tax=Pseudomonas aeruginosa TaxID=287 RepID=UPI000B5A51D5|nr:hypothetical protein [Pseudomonas aeruginosa]ASJ88846.1 hypothetical protein PSA83_06720 [Pseudomonas aeruginosa]